MGMFRYLALLTLAWPSQAFAQSISMTVVHNLNFPAMAIPESGTASLSISPLNSSTSGTATVLYGVASRGQINLSLGQDGGAVSASIDISEVSTGSPNLELTNFVGLYQGTLINGFPSPTLAPPSESPGISPLYIGATIVANPNLTPGSYVSSFVVNVIVQ
jgi:hypothetical protein